VAAHRAKAGRVGVAAARGVGEAGTACGIIGNAATCEDAAAGGVGGSGREAFGSEIGRGGGEGKSV